MFFRPSLGASVALALSLPAFANLSPDMQAVLDELGALGARPVSKLDVATAWIQASSADAAKCVQWKNRIPSAPEGLIATQDIAIPANGGNIAYDGIRAGRGHHHRHL